MVLCKSKLKHNKQIASGIEKAAEGLTALLIYFILSFRIGVVISAILRLCTHSKLYEGHLGTVK